MVDLPRSRALVAFDPNGFLLPVEPVTPAGSRVWRFLHRAPVLVAIGLALFVIAIFASNLAALALHQIGRGQRGLYAVPAIGTALVIASYVAFVRIVERRRRFDELELPVAPQETLAGLVGGLALFAVAVLLVRLAEQVTVAGLAPAASIVPTLIAASGGAIVQEIIMRGEIFRLIERLAGSWLALALSAGGLGVIRVLTGDPTMPSVLAVIVENGILFGAVFMLTRRLWAGIGLHIGWSCAPILVSLEAYGFDGVDVGASAVTTSWQGLGVVAAACVVLLMLAVRRSRIVAPAWTRSRPSRRRQRAVAEFG